MLNKKLLKYTVSIVCIASLAGCVTAVRKVGGQIRPTEVEIKNCPHMTETNYALMVPDALSMKSENHDALSKEYRHLFYQSLENAFKQNGLSIVRITSKDQSNNLPIIAIQFDKLSHSFVENSWELTGNIQVINNNKTNSYPFDAYTHKTVESKKSLVNNLADKMVGCIVKENN